MRILLGFVLLPLIILITASLTSGLELSASTGGSSGISSTHVAYGATVDDYSHENIQLNPGADTLSNTFSGSGSLPSGSISISDTKGNYASVSRSISGKPRVTTWTYDWNTYYPSSSTAGSGVGAWLSLTAKYGYSIYGSGYASNKEGDITNAIASVGSSDTISSLSNYYVNPRAFTNEVDADQSATSASGTLVDVKSHAENRRPAYEGFANDPVNYGRGDFEVQAKTLANTKLLTTATTNNVVITPTLPTTIKTAVILEPVQKWSASIMGATDLGSTVFPDLVGKRICYAALHRLRSFRRQVLESRHL